MKRANVKIKGNVQMAGFRTFIKNIADSFNIKGIAENLEDGSVEYGEYKGEFTSFERSGGDVPQKATLDDLLGVLKSFDSKAERLVSILSDTNVTLKSVKEDTSSIKEDTKLISGIKENTEKMLEKQDDTIAEIRALSQPFSFRKKSVGGKEKNL
ncbi:MAG: acylphosphatase [Methanophagales archaeon]|nr:acylphosphatase [Methanophagales archaeon]